MPASEITVVAAPAHYQSESQCDSPPMKQQETKISPSHIETAEGAPQNTAVSAPVAAAAKEPLIFEPIKSSACVVNPDDIEAGQPAVAVVPVVVSEPTRCQRVFWVIVAAASVIMGIYALQYWGIELFVPDNIAANRYKRGWLVLHATAAAGALFTGPPQFVPSLRRRRPRLHRIMGRIYGFCVLASSIAAMILAVGVSTGPVSAVGFFLLATCWIGTTVLGVVQARRVNIPSHRRWMIRSFALALSAVTLRAYLPIGINIAGGDFDAAYRVIAWLCWVPNLIAAEIYIRLAKK